MPTGKFSQVVWSDTKWSSELGQGVFLAYHWCFVGNVDSPQIRKTLD